MRGSFSGDARLDRTPEEIIKLTQDKPLEFEPGSKFSYDNSGYITLGYIIEKVSGEHYADYVQHHIFDPLGMKSTGYDVSETIMPKRASGYDWTKTKFINTPYLSMTEPYSAGSLYSTVDDMLVWDQALYSGKPLGPHSFQEMFTDYGHGYGWFIDNQFGHRHIWHSGGINGFVRKFDRYPEDKLTIVVFSNESNAPVARIADGLAALYLGVPPRTAAPGGEALLRRTVEALRQGAPNYDQMGEQMADITRAQLPGLQKMVGNLGEIKSVTLLAAEPAGVDRYRVTFQNGATEWDIKISDDGKLASAGFHPIH
jgi:CubicO group peptidase (beta-lactamase class C family)